MSTLKKVAFEIYQHLDSPISLSCWLKLKYGELASLVAMTIDPNDYLDCTFGAQRFAKDYQAVKLLSKYNGFRIPELTEEALVRKANVAFTMAEMRNAATNGFLRNVRDGYLTPEEEVVGLQLRDLLSSAKKVAGRILGSLDQIDIKPRFGPGSTAELLGAGTYSTVLDKVATMPHVTSDCQQIYRWWYDHTVWSTERSKLGLPHLALSRGNVFTTVPKKATARRGIAGEPGGNVEVQLGVGGYLKRRLGRWGLMVGRAPTDDPADWAVRVLQHRVLTRRSAIVEETRRNMLRHRSEGQKIHGARALRASITGEDATIDLRDASNLQCLELVRSVIPGSHDPEGDWFGLFDAIRSKKTLYGPPGCERWSHNEMFSSMGNGFTFELMTLILASVLSAAFGLKIGTDLLVYGDDIIIPSRCYTRAVVLLELLGYMVNTSKSYASGVFRESCGTDAFYGYDVTPVCLKQESLTDIDAIYGFHNIARQRGALNQRASEAVIALLPTDLRFYGPARVANVLHGWPRDRWVVRKRKPSQSHKPLTVEVLPDGSRKFVPGDVSRWKHRDENCLWLKTLLVVDFSFEVDRWDSTSAYIYAVYGGSSEVGARKLSALRSFRSGWTSVS